MLHTNDNQFLELLEGNRQRRLYATAPLGNSGDHLLRHALSVYLTDRGFLVVPSPQDADAILIHGGGNIDDVWGCGVDHFTEIAAAYPEKPIIVAPSTAHFRTTDFAAVLNRCTQRVHFFAREQYTHRRMRAMNLGPHITLGIADDTAFLMPQTSYFTTIEDSVADNHVLCAFRTDRESRIFSTEYDPHRWSVRADIRYMAMMRRLRTVLRERHPEIFRARRVVIDDVSHRPFDTFVSQVAAASAIYTDRLHVAILGALLKKTVYLYPTQYEKTKGVYEYTLYKFPTVVPMFETGVEK